MATKLFFEVWATHKNEYGKPAEFGHLTIKVGTLERENEIEAWTAHENNCTLDATRVLFTWQCNAREREVDGTVNWYGADVQTRFSINPKDNQKITRLLTKLLGDENVSSYYFKPANLLARLAELKAVRLVYDGKLDDVFFADNPPAENVDRWYDNVSHISPNYRVIAESESDAVWKLRKCFANDVLKGNERAVRELDRWIKAECPVRQAESGWAQRGDYRPIDDIVNLK